MDPIQLSPLSCSFCGGGPFWRRIGCAGFFLGFVNVIGILVGFRSFGGSNMGVLLSISSDTLLLTLTFIAAMDGPIFRPVINAGLL